MGIYWDLMEMPLAMYKWAEGAWVPLLATSWELKPPDLFTVELRKGVKWSDGTDFTSKDVLTTFDVGRLMDWTVWKYLDRVEAVDDHTVNFYMKKPSTVVVRYVLRERIRANSVYGEWAEKLRGLVAKGLTKEDDEWKALLKEFDEFRPEEMVVSGPFKIDPASITEAQLTLKKVPTAWNADKVLFDEIVLYNGETPDVTPIVLAKEVDYATHGFPPATEKEFVDIGLRILRPPIYSGPAIYFNHDIYPFNLKEFRHAIAYAINREENATVSLGESAIPPKYMAGFSDALVPIWLPEEDIAKLHSYPYDPAKAEEILKGLGFTRGPDGIWVDDKGNKLEFEVIAPSEYVDWATAAENLAEQLTKFGIKVVFRGITYTEHPIVVRRGDFQLAIREWGRADPHPHFSFARNLFRYNYVEAVEGKGMNFPMVQDTEVVGKIDFEEATVKSAEGLDEAKQKELIARVALAFNELLPIIPLWERFGNNPCLEDVRVTGWPPEGDPIYTNAVYADSFVILMILDGTLKPVR
jgi:peptide/nickel transport system substrate-binding protein